MTYFIIASKQSFLMFLWFIHLFYYELDVKGFWRLRHASIFLSKFRDLSRAAFISVGRQNATLFDTSKFKAISIHLLNVQSLLSDNDSWTLLSETPIMILTNNSYSNTLFFSSTTFVVVRSADIALSKLEPLNGSIQNHQCSHQLLVSMSKMCISFR